MSLKWHQIFHARYPAPPTEHEVIVQAPCSFCRKYFDQGMLKRKGKKLACRGCLPRLLAKTKKRRR
jgi:hypothetical protein